MRILSLLLATLFCFCGLVLAQDKLSTKVEAIPMVFQASGNSNATLEPTRYPLFSDFESKFPDCEARLKELSGKPKPGKNEYSAVPGLSLDLTVPEAYRKNSNILITWTLRVEGEPKKVSVSSICSPWWGTVTQTFNGGKVFSRAYVDLNDGKGFKDKGQELDMTIPDGPSIKVKTPPPSDPTHSGSFLLEPPAGGEFSSKIKVKIYWKNDTCMKIISKGHYRSLIVSLVPPERK